MNYWLLSAACLMLLIGIVHSVLGEHLVFRRLRGRGLIPTEGGALLLERHVRILWATWHLTSLLGWFIAAVLLLLADDDAALRHGRVVLATGIALATFLGALLVLVGTRGRHPGWLGLLIVSVLCLIGAERL